MILVTCVNLNCFNGYCLFQPTTGYPADKMFIGRWLGPVLGVSTAMIYKILRPNCGYICCETVCAWIPIAEANASLFTERSSCMTKLNDSIGPAADPEDFPYREMMPEFK